MAATILPFSSEVAFVVALEHHMSAPLAVGVASCGNILAIVLNYALGFWLYEKSKTKLFASKIGQKSWHFGRRYMYVALLFSWLPVVGDPLTLVAGLLRLKFIYFILIAGSLRIMRYVLIAYLV